MSLALSDVTDLRTREPAGGAEHGVEQIERSASDATRARAFGYFGYN